MSLDKFKDRYLCSCTVIFFTLFLFFICGPVEVYAQNIIEFDFLISDFVLVFILITLIGTAVFSFIISIFPIKLFKIAVSFICSLNLVSYVQYLFFNKGISTSDGTLVDWSEKRTSSIIYTVIYILLFSALFLLFIKIKNNWKKTITGISFALILINSAALVSNVLSICSTNKEIPHYQLSAENQFDVAPNNNIIILVLDAVGNKTFEKYNNMYPELSECLQDFTYFDNYDSLYLPTMPSVSHILTGYEPSVEYSKYQWSDKAWKSEGCKAFFDVIHKNQYVFNIYIAGQSYVFGNVNFLNGKIDNIENAENKTNYKLMFPMMLKYSMYRYVPYAIKERVEVNPNNFRGVVEYSIKEKCVEDNNEFCEIINKQKLSINSNWNNAIIVEHINGMHSNNDDNLSESEYYTSSMNAIDEYLCKLKEIGKYDDSVIIVCSDHGSHEDLTDRQAIFFIKYQNEKHKQMQINSAPISSDDFQATIVDIIGESDYSAFGTRISDWQEGDKRERTTYITSNELPSGLWGYTYYTDRYELKDTMEDGFDVNCPGGW